MPRWPTGGGKAHVEAAGRIAAPPAFAMVFSLVRPTIGPLTRAAFWEVIAVPDIRNE
jgi:hypothetical protein